MAQKLSPISLRPFLDANGDPYSGALLFCYTAGSSTKATVTRDMAGATPHANPIVLNTRGEIDNGSGSTVLAWQTEGSTLDFVLAPSTDTDPPIAAISTFEDIIGINDTTVAIDQWVGGPTPTFVSTTSFTLVGDQTSTFHIGRRLKTTNTSGSIYSTIITSAYTSLTTITVVNDSGVLDSGLSAVSYGLVSATNSSISSEAVTPIYGPAIASATALPWPAYGDYSHVTGTTTITSFVTSGQIGKEFTREFDGALILTHHATNLILPGGANITTAAGDVFRFIEYASGTVKCIGGTLANGHPFGGGASKVLLQSQTASASASIDFTTNIDSTYDEYELHIIGMVPATDAVSPRLKVSKDAGSTWEAGTSYRYVNQRIIDNGTAGYAASTGGAAFDIATDVGNASGEYISGVIKFYSPSSTTLNKGFTGEFIHVASAADTRRTVFGGNHMSITAIDGVQILCSTGNITSGEFLLYGIRKV